MKIAIGYNLQDAPWGGGNQFCQSLVKLLKERGHSVCFTLLENDIDVILLTDPRRRSKSVSFGASDIIYYLLTKNPNTIVLHRINECDERKNTKTMNFRLRLSNYVADHTIFIASWLMELNIWGRESTHSIIPNGADSDIFHSEENKEWDGEEPLKLVTHHWGGNWMKGFDVYQIIDKMLIEAKWKSLIDFTYIGNTPINFEFKNAHFMSPLQGRELAKELSKHHVYITASINEPAGMHHIEGALSGLPILYRESGALPEYCKGFGIPFKGNNFQPALIEILRNYKAYKSQMVNYPFTSKKMCSHYLSAIENQLAHRDQITSQRRLWRSPWKLLLILLFL